MHYAVLDRLILIDLSLPGALGKKLLTFFSEVYDEQRAVLGEWGHAAVTLRHFAPGPAGRGVFLHHRRFLRACWSHVIVGDFRHYRRGFGIASVTQVPSVFSFRGALVYRTCSSLAKVQRSPYHGLQIRANSTPK